MERDGFALVDDVLAPEAVRNLIAAPGSANAFQLRRGGDTYGARNLLTIDAVRRIVNDPATRALVEPFAGENPHAVRALFFDKTPEANWPVAWHQDLSVALAARTDVDGWTGWSVKAGVVHAQPPQEILTKMITLRIHLDVCDEDNGPLRVLPGSHRHGRLSRDAIERWRSIISDISCCGPVGSALLMRPLILHASSPARSPNHRRVLQIEFAPENVLPAALRWAA